MCLCVIWSRASFWFHFLKRLESQKREKTTAFSQKKKKTNTQYLVSFSLSLSFFLYSHSVYMYTVRYCIIVYEKELLREYKCFFACNFARYKVYCYTRIQTRALKIYRARVVVEPFLIERCWGSDNCVKYFTRLLYKLYNDRFLVLWCPPLVNFSIVLFYSLVG